MHWANNLVKTGFNIKILIKTVFRSTQTNKGEYIKNHLNINDFEQSFNDSTLKSALRLAREGTIYIEKYKDGGQSFTFPTGETTRVVRKGDKITALKCTCGKKYCVHMAAALFSFQKDLIGKLSKEVRKHSQRKQDLFPKYRKLIKEEQEKNSFVPGIKKLLKQEKDAFYIALAVFCELNAGQPENTLLIDRCKEKLKEWMGSSLDPSEQQVLQQAALLLTSQKYFRSGAYSAIIPYVSSHATNVSFVNELSERLEKRRSPAQSLVGVDEKAIALSHLMVAEKRITGEKIPAANRTAEYYLALAQHYLMHGKKKKATSSLREGHERLLKKRDIKLTGYLERAVELAAAYGDVTTELLFIKELFIHELFIRPFYIGRIKELLGGDKQKLFADTIIDAIKMQPESFDKHYHLLLSQERYQEAMQLIGTHTNKFRYANEVMQQMEHINEKAIDIYVNQFSSAILAAPETHFQEKIFQNALLFLSCLDAEQRTTVMRRILGKLPKQSYIYQQISGHIAANLRA